MMNEGIVAAADIATGAVIASAVEPDAGKMGPTTRGDSCLNCGAALLGAHCHACGQKGHIHRTMAAFGHDLLHGVFHFEGKIWRTLPMLFWNPGHLTRRYIHGERAKFVSPLALFLFTVFLTFAIFNAVIGDTPEFSTQETVAIRVKTLDAEIERSKESVKRIERKRSEAVNDPAALAEADEELADAKKILADKTLENTSKKETLLREEAAAKSKIAEIDTEIASIDAAIETATAKDLDVGAFRAKRDALKIARNIAVKGQEALTAPMISTSLLSETGNFFWNDKKLNDLARKAIADPKLLAYKLQSSAYKFSWALIPISVPFIWLLFFWRREFKIFDHAVFATYSITFMLLWSSLIAVAGHYEFGGDGLLAALLLFPLLHMYRQLKQAYGLSWYGAVARSALMWLFAIFALLAFAIMIFYLGITG